MAVSASELAAIQSEAAKWTCDKTCTIWRDSTLTTPDGYGHTTLAPTNTGSYTQVGGSIKCGVGEPSGTHLQNYDYLIATEVAWLVHLPVGTDIQERDHIVLENQTLVVHVILTPHSYPALLSVIAAELK